MSNSSSKSGVENFLCNNATAAKISKLSTEISCDDFITIMAVVISILIVLGIFLVVCLIRYPSYTTEENLRRDRRLRKGNRSNSSATVVTIQHDAEEGEGAITQLPSDGSEFRKPSTTSTPNYRLPTPGGALPAGRLPPLNREDYSDSGGSSGVGNPPDPPGINVETLQEIEIIDHDEEEDDNDSVSAIVSPTFR